MRSTYKNLLLFIAFTAYFESSVPQSAPAWDDLRVTWGQALDTAFLQQPRTVEEAKQQGFKLVGSETCGESGAYNGLAFVKDNDYAMTLLFDINGFIAGMQHGIPNDVAESKGIPSKTIQPPYVFEENRYVVSAYFTDPSKICSEGRTQQDFETEGTGTDLWIQTGSNANEVTLVPREESGLAATNWTEGKCFQTMGKHYWYDVTEDMACDSFFPVFLLYNRGKLNSFGWASLGNLPSTHYEHPTAPVISMFMEVVPKCALSIPDSLSTMHIYLTSTPWTNAC